MFVRRAHIAVLLTAMGMFACGGETHAPTDDVVSPDRDPDGKADHFGAPTSYEGACAADAPANPYQPVPGPTAAQPDGPEVFETRNGVVLPVDFTSGTSLYGGFSPGDCGRHYFTFTLERAARLSIRGASTSDGTPTALGLCFAKPAFLRIDAPWYDDIWERQPVMSDVPCGAFVPVSDRLEPADGQSLEFGPGVYELTIDPEMSAAAYDLEFSWEPLGGAVCGDGLRDPGEGCDDGNQHPLDWCGSDCQPTRMDVEPLAGNETVASAQSLDGFRDVGFHADPGLKEVDVYRIELAAGERLEIRNGERACDRTFVELLGTDAEPVSARWDCTGDAGTEFDASYDGTHYLRLETETGGSRSVTLKILP